MWSASGRLSHDEGVDEADDATQVLLPQVLQVRVLHTLHSTGRACYLTVTNTCIIIVHIPNKHLQAVPISYNTPLKMQSLQSKPAYKCEQLWDWAKGGGVTGWPPDRVSLSVRPFFED